MFGRFLFGALTGFALVGTGLVMSSALFPPHASKGTVQTAGAEANQTATPEPEAVNTDADVAATEATEAAATDDSAEPEAVAETAAEPVTENVETEVAASSLGETGEQAGTAAPSTSNAETTEEPAAEASATEMAATVEPEAEVPAAAEPVAEAATALDEAAQPVVEDTAPAAPAATGDAQTEAPVVAEVTAPSEPAAPAVLDEPETDTTTEVTAADEVTAAPAATTTEVATATAESTVEPASEPAVEPVEEAATEAQPEGTADPAAEPVIVAEAQPETALQPEAETEPAADPAVEDQPVLVTEPQPEAMPEAATGDETEAAAVASEEEPSSTFASTPGFASEGTVVAEPTEAPVEEPAEADDRPIALYAAAFENPEAKPVMAVVLIDTGAADLDRAALAALPFPVSFALDPMDPATPERAAAYRAAGREVIMLATGIAPGAQASDIEVAFQAMSQALPEAVAVMDLADPVFQNDRPLATLVVPVVGGQGLGVLTWEKGLNAADQVARRDDIASAVVFRDLAAGGGDAAAAKRTLDRAVFKAGQDQRVVVAGAITPDLIAALIEWSVEGRAGAVALGPVTAVLKVD